MTRKERENSYEYYKQWQLNKNRYQHECVAYVLLFGFGMIFVLTHWQGILLGLGIGLIGVSIYFIGRIILKWFRKNKALSDLRTLVQELGAGDIEVDSESGSISFVFSSDTSTEELEKFEKSLSEKGLKMKITRTKIENNEDDVEVKPKDSQFLKSTDVGYVNKNNQKNNGRTNQQGSDNNQYFYEMECLSCGHIYYANGTDIWQRKCPKCQGGKS